MKGSRSVIRVFGLLVAGIIVPGAVQACSLSVRQDSGESVATAVGGQAVLVVSFTQTHRHCTVPAGKTEIKGDGVKILTATPWAETKPGTFQRKLKVEYERMGTNGVKALRSCSRGGDEATLLVVVP